MTTSSSGFLPENLVSTLKGELLSLERESRTRTLLVEYHVEHGIAREARIRNRESLHIVALTS